MKMEKSSETKAYNGNCHCGLFQFTLNMAPLTTVWTCNCSICSRNGYLWIWPVAEKQLLITAGNENALHVYQFAMRGTKHLFCPECGSSILARRREAPPDQSLRINARMLEDIDLTNLQVKKFSGAEIGPKYEPQHPPPSNTMETTKEVATELQKYSGNCHCGQFKFSFNAPEIKKGKTCNCSICLKNGYVWLFPVKDENFTVERGENTLISYESGSKRAIHMFCPKCGTSVMATRKTSPPGANKGINLRVLQDFDMTSLETIENDGQALTPKYEPPTSYPDIELSEGEDDLKLYNGNCHCGSVKYTVKTKPLTSTKVMSCNCSLCSRNGDLWIYPPKSAVKIEGRDNLTGYVLVAADSLHAFCKTCGVSVLVNITDPKEDMLPLNVRTLKDIDLEELEYTYYDGKSKGTPYTVPE